MESFSKGLSFSPFVAVRYLFSVEGREEGSRFLRFISYIAIGGVAVGVAALLLALSIVHGFSREIEAQIVGFGSHIQVESFTEGPLENASTRAAQLAGIPGVERIAPVVTDFTLLRRSPTQIDGVALWGAEELPPYITQSLVEGTPSLMADKGQSPLIILGQTLARELGLQTGDGATVFAFRTVTAGGERSAGIAQRPRVRQFRVGGIYETALADYDALYAFVHIEQARDLLGFGADEVSRLDITLTDVTRAEETARLIEEELGFPVMARTIYQLFRGLFAWVNLQESIIPIIIGIIVIVAAFNIIGILLMFVLEKARSLGVMASMGASASTLRRLFLGLGLLIGLIGTAIGQVLALVLALIQQEFGVIPLPAEAYYMTTAPIHIIPTDFALVGILTIALCALCAYIPARVASRVQPVKVIRFR